MRSRILPALRMSVLSIERVTVTVLVIDVSGVLMTTILIVTGIGNSSISGTTSVIRVSIVLIDMGHAVLELCHFCCCYVRMNLST